MWRIRICTIFSAHIPDGVDRTGVYDPLDVMSTSGLINVIATLDRGIQNLCPGSFV
tara:strand:- start:1577 stop:1744 length:168 start_codon:yes stop_codon:yes gene_type:complete